MIDASIYMSSVGDINRKKLDALCKKLAASHESSFEANLKAVFDVHGQRQAGNPLFNCCVVVQGFLKQFKPASS